MGECVTATPCPPHWMYILSNGGTLEIALTGATVKVDKICCLANTATVQCYRIVSL